MKQSKLRRRRVIRFAILYFTLLLVFVGLIAGPIAYKNNVATATKFLDKYNTKDGVFANFRLIQPDLGKNNTLGKNATGTEAATGGSKKTGGSSSSTGKRRRDEAQTTGKVKLF